MASTNPEQRDDPEFIPEVDIRLLRQFSDSMFDKVAWAYRLGRQQGKIEAADELLQKLRGAKK